MQASWIELMELRKVGFGACVDPPIPMTAQEASCAGGRAHASHSLEPHHDCGHTELPVVGQVRARAVGKNVIFDCS